MLGKAVTVHKVREGLTESEALQIEAIFGLIPQSGMLANLDEGVKPRERRAMYRGAYKSSRLINSAFDKNEFAVDSAVIPSPDAGSIPAVSTNHLWGRTGGRWGGEGAQEANGRRLPRNGCIDSPVG